MWCKGEGIDEATGGSRFVVVDADSAGDTMTQARDEGIRARHVAATERPAGAAHISPTYNVAGWPKAVERSVRRRLHLGPKVPGACFAGG
jgi:hypothetical protein